MINLLHKRNATITAHSKPGSFTLQRIDIPCSLAQKCVAKARLSAVDSVQQLDLQLEIRATERTNSLWDATRKDLAPQNKNGFNFMVD